MYNVDKVDAYQATEKASPPNRWPRKATGPVWDRRAANRDLAPTGDFVGAGGGVGWRARSVSREVEHQHDCFIGGEHQSQSLHGDVARASKYVCYSCILDSQIIHSVHSS